MVVSGPVWIPAFAGMTFCRILADECGIEIIPVGIVFLDQGHLPRAAPFLDLFLPVDGNLGGYTPFKPNERMHAISAGKAFDQVFLVRRDAPDNVGRDAGIECPIPLAGENVDKE